jgi:hypothetical protein
VRAAELDFEVRRGRMMAPHIHHAIRPPSALQRLVDGSEYPSPPYEYDATGYPVTNLLVDRQHPLHSTGVTWLGQPVFTPTNSGYTQLRPRPDNNNAPTGGPIQSPPLDLHASPHVDTIAREFVGDDGIRMAAPVSEAQRSVVNLTNAMAGSTPRVHLPAWIVEHMTHAPVPQVVPAPVTQDASDAHDEPNLVPIDPDMPTLDDQDDDNDDAPPEAVHGPDGDDDDSPARCTASPRRRGDMCPYRYEAMTQRHMYDPDRTYLDVDFTGTPDYVNSFNQFAKDCGARFDWEKRLFYIPTNICPMAALCVFPAISYARHLSVQIVKYQRDQGMAPSLRQVDDHLGLVRPQRMLVPLIPFSRVRVVVGPGARDRVVRNRRTMSSVIIGMMTFMTCMVSAESALSMTAHHHNASVFANEVNPVVYLLLAAGALALTVFMLHQHHGRVGTAAELNRDLLGMFLLRQRLNRAPTEREIEAERQRLYVVQYIQDLRSRLLPLVTSSVAACLAYVCRACSPIAQRILASL